MLNLALSVDAEDIFSSCYGLQIFVYQEIFFKCIH